MKFFLSSLIFILSTFIFTSNCFASSTPCTSTSQESGGIYQITFHLIDHHVNPARVPAGTVLGPLQLNPMTVTCGEKKNDFSFQLVPNETEVETTADGKHVCDIGVIGIGVIWYSNDGSSIGCNKWDDIFVINHGSTVNEAGYRIGEIVRTSKHFEHYGIYTVTIPDMTINLNWNGHANYGLWGKASTDGAITFLISSCALVDGVKPINFGNINIDQSGTSALAQSGFVLEMNQCMDNIDRQNFIDAATFVFSSPTLNAEGKIDNSSCEGCGKGIDIAIYDATNKLVDLNEKLSMEGATLSGDTSLLYQFNAVLEKNATETPVEGDINASLIIIISYV